MDKQLIFFLMLSFLFLVGGAISLNIIMQLAGILIIIFLIHDFYSNAEENEKYKGNYVGRFNFIKFLGDVDLFLGILFLISGLYGTIPFIFIYFLALILLMKGFIFIWGGDIASMLDILSSIIIISSNVVEVPLFVIIGISIYLIQKGAFSFFS